MSSTNLVIRGHRVVLPEFLGPATIHVADETIADVRGFDDLPPDCEVIEAGNSIIMPGLVDSHVHVNEPGRTEWEGFATATRAAAAGGITTIVDMPLNSIPPTTTLAGLTEKMAAAREQSYVDVAFWGGVVPGNEGVLAELWNAGVVGFKCFLIDSGVAEFRHVTEADLRLALPELTRLGAVLIVHAEMPGPVNSAEVIAGAAAATEYKTFLASRPRAAEDEAVALMVRLSREFNARVHIVHHSSADSLPLLQAAKNEGLPITAETCPHYLSFVAEDIPAGATEFKCCPPIREGENSEQLWRALADGTIDMIVSDHSPCPPEMKLPETGDFLKAWGGISSLQLRLPIIWTEAEKRGFSLQDVTRWLCTAPAKLVGLDKRKGSIARGQDADFVIWNAEREFQVSKEMLHHRHKVTPYEGKTLKGVVEKTFLRGRKVYDSGEFVSGVYGDLLTPKRQAA